MKKVIFLLVSLSVLPIYLFAQDEIQTAKGSGLKFYGFLRLDIGFNDNRANHPRWDQFIPSGSDESQMTIYPNLTRFGMDFNGPEVDLLGDAKLSGKIEIDFDGLANTSSRDYFRMRHAYFKLDWENFSVLGGQSWDIISPNFPSVNSDVLLWNAGNTGDRRPQFRFDFHPKVGEGTLSVTAGLVLVGAVNDINGASGGFLSGELSGTPGIQARIGYKMPFIWDGQFLNVGVWGHFGSQEVASGTDYDTNSFGLDISMPIYRDRVWIKGEFWTGEGLADIRGGIGQNINAAGDEISSVGGFLEVGFKATDFYTLGVGISMDDPDDNDLDAGMRDMNRAFYFYNKFNLGQFTVGLEYINWLTEYTTGVADGDSNRFNLYFMYSF